MDSRVKRRIQTRLCLSKMFRMFTVNASYSLRVSQISVLRHGLVCQNLLLRRFCKLTSCGCTSFQVGQRWNTRRDMLNVTHRHVFVSQQVCRHQSFSVWTCAWPRLVDDSFVWKHCGRDKTWEIRWQVTYRHVLLCENLHTYTTL